MGLSALSYIMHYETLIHLSRDHVNITQIMMFLQIQLCLVVTHEARASTFGALSLAIRSPVRRFCCGNKQKERFHACPSQQRIFAALSARRSQWHAGLYLQPFVVPNSNNNATTKANAGDTFIANFVRNFLEEFLRHYTKRCKSFVCHLDHIIHHHVHIRKTNAQTLNTQLESSPTQGKQCAGNALDETVETLWSRAPAPKANQTATCAMNKLIWKIETRPKRNQNVTRELGENDADREIK